MGSKITGLPTGGASTLAGAAGASTAPPQGPSQSTESILRDILSNALLYLQKGESARGALLAALYSLNSPEETEGEKALLLSKLFDPHPDNLLHESCLELCRFLLANHDLPADCVDICFEIVVACKEAPRDSKSLTILTMADQYAIGGDLAAARDTLLVALAMNVRAHRPPIIRTLYQIFVGPLVRTVGDREAICNRLIKITRELDRQYPGLNDKCCVGILNLTRTLFRMLSQQRCFDGSFRFNCDFQPELLMKLLNPFEDPLEAYTDSVDQPIFCSQLERLLNPNHDILDADELDHLTRACTILEVPKPQAASTQWTDDQLDAFLKAQLVESTGPTPTPDPEVIPPEVLNNLTGAQLITLFDRVYSLMDGRPQIDVGDPQLPKAHRNLLHLIQSLRQSDSNTSPLHRLKESNRWCYFKMIILFNSFETEDYQRSAFTTLQALLDVYRCLDAEEKVQAFESAIVAYRNANDPAGERECLTALLLLTADTDAKRGALSGRIKHLYVNHKELVDISIHRHFQLLLPLWNSEPYNFREQFDRQIREYNKTFALELRTQPQPLAQVAAEAGPPQASEGNADLVENAEKLKSSGKFAFSRDSLIAAMLTGQAKKPILAYKRLFLLYSSPTPWNTLTPLTADLGAETASERVFRRMLEEQLPAIFRMLALQRNADGSFTVGRNFDPGLMGDYFSSLSLPPPGDQTLTNAELGEFLTEFFDEYREPPSLERMATFVATLWNYRSDPTANEAGKGIPGADFKRLLRDFLPPLETPQEPNKVNSQLFASIIGCSKGQLFELIKEILVQQKQLRELKPSAEIINHVETNNSRLLVCISSRYSVDVLISLYGDENPQSMLLFAQFLYRSSLSADASQNRENAFCFLRALMRLSAKVETSEIESALVTCAALYERAEDISGARECENMARVFNQTTSAAEKGRELHPHFAQLLPAWQGSPPDLATQMVLPAPAAPAADPETQMVLPAPVADPAIRSSLLRLQASYNNLFTSFCQRAMARPIGDHRLASLDESIQAAVSTNNTAVLTYLRERYIEILNLYADLSAIKLPELRQTAENCGDLINCLFSHYESMQLIAPFDRNTTLLHDTLSDKTEEVDRADLEELSNWEYARYLLFRQRNANPKLKGNEPIIAYCVAICLTNQYKFHLYHAMATLELEGDPPAHHNMALPSPVVEFITRRLGKQTLTQSDLAQFYDAMIAPLRKYKSRSFGQLMAAAALFHFLDPNTFPELPLSDTLFERVDRSSRGAITKLEKEYCNIEAYTSTLPSDEAFYMRLEMILFQYAPEALPVSYLIQRGAGLLLPESSTSKRKSQGEPPIYALVAKAVIETTTNIAANKNPALNAQIIRTLETLCQARSEDRVLEDYHLIARMYIGGERPQALREADQKFCPQSSPIRHQKMDVKSFYKSTLRELGKLPSLPDELAKGVAEHLLCHRIASLPIVQRAPSYAACSQIKSDTLVAFVQFFRLQEHQQLEGEEAIALGEALLGEGVDDPQLLGRQCELLEAAGRYEEALALYHRAGVSEECELGSLVRDEAALAKLGRSRKDLKQLEAKLSKLRVKWESAPEQARTLRGDIARLESEIAALREEAAPLVALRAENEGVKSQLQAEEALASQQGETTARVSALEEQIAEAGSAQKKAQGALRAQLKTIERRELALLSEIETLKLAQSQTLRGHFRAFRCTLTGQYPLNPAMLLKDHGETMLAGHVYERDALLGQDVPPEDIAELPYGAIKGVVEVMREQDDHKTPLFEVPELMCTALNQLSTDIEGKRASQYTRMLNRDYFQHLKQMLHSEVDADSCVATTSEIIARARLLLEQTAKLFLHARGGVGPLEYKHDLAVLCRACFSGTLRREVEAAIRYLEGAKEIDALPDQLFDRWADIEVRGGYIRDLGRFLDTVIQLSQKLIASC